MCGGRDMAPVGPCGHSEDVTLSERKDKWHGSERKLGKPRGWLLHSMVSGEHIHDLNLEGNC